MGLPNAGVTCGDDKSSVNEAVKLQGPYVRPDCVAGQSFFGNHDLDQTLKS